MSVVDASAVVEALLGPEVHPDLLLALAGELEAPHLLDVEVLSVLRGLERAGKIQPAIAHDALSVFFSLSIARYDTKPLSERIWSLRHQFTSYDATYLALAEATGAPLVTCDAKLATRGHRAQVYLVPRLGSTT